MKNFSKPFSFAIVPLLAFTLVSCNDKKEPDQGLVSGETTTDFVPGKKNIDLVAGKKYIVLLVNTAYADSVPNAAAKDFCSFPLQHGVSDSLYTTEVFKRDTVVWLGVSTSAPTEDKIRITMINHRGGKNILGPTRAVDGKVEGIISDSDDLYPGDEESYAIHFNVTTAGNPARPYRLDPILRVH